MITFAIPFLVFGSADFSWQEQGLVVMTLLREVFMVEMFSSLLGPNTCGCFFSFFEVCDTSVLSVAGASKYTYCHMKTIH